MTANFQQELDRIVERRSQATQLDTLIQGYRLCARTEGKSENTITIYSLATVEISLCRKSIPIYRVSGGVRLCAVSPSASAVFFISAQFVM